MLPVRLVLRRKRRYVHKDVVAVQDAAQGLVRLVDLIEAVVEDISHHHLTHTHTHTHYEAIQH